MESYEGLGREGRAEGPWGSGAEPSSRSEVSLLSSKERHTPTKKKSESSTDFQFSVGGGAIDVWWMLWMGISKSKISPVYLTIATCKWLQIRGIALMVT